MSTTTIDSTAVANYFDKLRASENVMDVEDDDGISLRDFADLCVKNCNLDMIQVLQEKGFKFTSSHVLLAILTGNVKILKEVTANRKGKPPSPMFHAVKSKSFDMVKFVHEKYGDKKCKCCLPYAASIGQFEIFRFLTENGYYLPSICMVEKCLEGGNLKCLEYVLENKIYDHTYTIWFSNLHGCVSAIPLLREHGFAFHPITFSDFTNGRDVACAARSGIKINIKAEDIKHLVTLVDEGYVS